MLTKAAITRITALATLPLTAWLATRAQPPSEERWFKGNLHTHTLNSDGDSTPLDVATWYRDHRYHFLILTDHNYLTGVEGLNSTLGARDRFLLIPGEEVTSKHSGKPIHVNAFAPDGLVPPAEGNSIADTIQRNIDAILSRNGLPSVNHPNFGWAMTSRELIAVEKMTHFEVYNGHPATNDLGGGGGESLDEMWNALLDAGRRVHGIAVDDAHHFKQIGPGFSNPGRGWVMVRAAALTQAAILDALRRGEFYASTGIELAQVNSGGGRLAMEIKPQGDTRYTTRFIGPGGKVLAASFDLNPSHRISSGWVRARIDDSNGRTAWVQPVFAP
jgi:predicted metal-dependent phosphoesterase TrpH